MFSSRVPMLSPLLLYQSVNGTRSGSMPFGVTEEVVEERRDCHQSLPPQQESSITKDEEA